MRALAASGKIAPSRGTLLDTVPRRSVRRLKTELLGTLLPWHKPDHLAEPGAPIVDAEHIDGLTAHAAGGAGLVVVVKATSAGKCPSDSGQYHTNESEADCRS